jgi:HEAT repeat protein
LTPAITTLDNPRQAWCGRRRHLATVATLTKGGNPVTRPAIAVTAVLVAWSSATGFGQSLLEDDGELGQQIHNLAAEDLEVRKAAAKELFSWIKDDGAAPAYSIGQYEMYEPVAVADFRRRAKPHLPKLIELLEHSDEGVAEAARLLVMRMGPAGKAATETLLKEARDENSDWEDRWAAVVVLLYITPETEAVIPKVLPLPKSVEKYSAAKNGFSFQLMNWMGIYWVDAIRTIIDSGHTSVEAPHLAKALLEPYPVDFRAMVTYLLGEMGRDAEAAVPTLEKLLDDEHEVVRWVAAESILKITLDEKRIPEIAERLKLAESEREAFEKAMVEHIEIWLSVEEWPADRDVPDETVRSFARAEVQFARGPRRRQALRMLANAGPAARAALPFIREVLNHKDEETRRLARIAMQRIQSDKPTETK